MKRVSVVSMAVVALLVLGACRGNENAVTGAYGSAVVTGEVVMTEGVSPEGVDVSVRGTGMSVRLGADGKFAFAGVPDDAELVFQRASDGIAATLRLGRGDGHVVVELAQTTAKKSGRRRAAGSKTSEYEGILQSASATEIVIDAARQGIVTIALAPQTVIRKGGTVLTAADLVAGMRVHVKALKVNDVLTATLVIVQNEDDDDGDDDGPAVREYEGTVLSASATELVIFDSKKKEVTFVLDAATEIRKGSTPVLATDIQPGWRVHVKATTGADGTNTARLVIVQRNK